MNGPRELQPNRAEPARRPARPTPTRPLRLRNATIQKEFGVFLLALCVVGCLLVAVFSSVDAARQAREFQHLQQAGVTAKGLVISRTPVGRGSARLTYRFTAASAAGAGQSFDGQTVVDFPRQPPALPYPIDILYDPADPRVSRLAGDSRPPATVAGRMFPFCWLGWPPLLGGVMMVVLARKQRAKAERLEREGRLAPGMILERWHQRGRWGGPSVSYQFEALLHDGQPRQIVKAEIVDLITQFERLEAGAPVQVRYLPGDPTVSQIEWADIAAERQPRQRGVG